VSVCERVAEELIPVAIAISKKHFFASTLQERMFPNLASSAQRNYEKFGFILIIVNILFAKL
jgi:hypothetical protein